jgi:hypothetical protein
MIKINDFWDVLFNKDEHTCFALNKYGTELFPVRARPPWAPLFFSINPMRPGESRRDDNVTCLRNILVEFDKGSSEQQMEMLRGVPYSTLVWSGGKSHHAVISLEKPCTNREQYTQLFRRIQAKLPALDAVVKNPSRLSRVPGVMRDNGKLQHLIDVRKRIGQETLEAWLGPIPEKLKTEGPKWKSLALSPWTKYFLMFGSSTGSRNTDLLKAACDMFRHGYDFDTIKEKAETVLDLPPTEINATIRSAERLVRRG